MPLFHKPIIERNICSYLRYTALRGNGCYTTTTQEKRKLPNQSRSPENNRTPMAAMSQQNPSVVIPKRKVMSRASHTQFVLPIINNLTPVT